METPIDYDLLAVFVAVAEERSFSKAARKLNIGKGTVSRAIARLEEVAGAELIHRTTHSVAVSTAGAALYDRTASHLAALDNAVVQLPEHAEQPSGLLRLTAARDFGALVLPHVLAEFSRRYRDVTFDVRITNSIVDLVTEGFDVAIRASPRMRDSTLTVRRLASAHVDFFAAPSYIARRGKPKRLGAEGHDWVLHPAFIRWMKLPVEASVRFFSDDLLLARDLIRDGVGIGLLPRFVASTYVRDGLLESVPIAHRVPAGGHLYIVYPSSGQVPRKVLAFRDFLIDFLRKTPLE